MSEVLLSSMPETDVNKQIAVAMKAGCDGDSSAAVASLEASFGPIIGQIIALIQSGLANLPAILAALTAMGIVLPSWMNLIIQLLLILVPKPAPTV